MEPVRLQPPPPLPLLRPMRLAIPDFQEVDFPVKSDCSTISSDDESEYYVSNEYHSSTDDDREGYDSDLESGNPICEGVDFPAVLDAPSVKEEIESREDKIEDCVSSEDENCTEDEGESSGGDLILVRGADYDLDLEYNEQQIYFQQVDEREGVDFTAVLDSPRVKEEIDSSKDGSEGYVSNEDDNSTNDEDNGDVINMGKVKSMDYDLDLEHDKTMWESYFRQVYESKGFDIKDYPGPPPLPTFYPIPSYLRIHKKYRMLKGYAESALKKYDDNTGTNHVIEEVLSAKRGGSRDYIYYLIFLAKTGDREMGYFQAMVIPDQEDNLDFLVVRTTVKRPSYRCYLGY